MRRRTSSAALWALALSVLLAVPAIAGCGGGDHGPEEEISNTFQRVEKAEGDLLLAKVEYEQAFFREAPEQSPGDPAKIAKARRRDVAEAHHLKRECHEGNGLEPCASIEAIGEVVEELDQEAREARK